MSWSHKWLHSALIALSINHVNSQSSAHVRRWLVFPCNASPTTLTSTWRRRKPMSLVVVHEETRPQWDVGRTLVTPARNTTEESPCHDLGPWVTLGLQEKFLNEYNSLCGLCLASVTMKSVGLILLGCSFTSFWQCKWAWAWRKYSPISKPALLTKVKMFLLGNQRQMSLFISVEPMILSLQQSSWDWNIFCMRSLR